MRYFLAFVFPPLAVLACGRPLVCLLNCVLTVCGLFPGVLHALLVVNSFQADQRMRRLRRQW